MLRNTYDPGTQTITLPAVRADVMAEVASHYESLSGNAPETASLTWH